MPIVPLKKPASKTRATARVVVVGGANMDVAGRAHTALMPEDSTPGEIGCSPGGVARNVADNLARLTLNDDTQVALISAVGDDLFGDQIVSATRAAGVDVSAVAVLPLQRTSAYLSVHGPDGDMAFGVNDTGVLQNVTPALLQGHADLISSAACLVLDCNLQPAAIEWLMQCAEGKPIFAEAVSVAKCAKLLLWLARLHTLQVNRFEAQALTGVAVAGPQQASLAALRLHELGVGNVVLTLGAQGVCWCDALGETGHQAAAKVEVVNTTGAGDALMAGLVHAHLHGMPLAQAVGFAMTCAELTVASPYANAPGLSQLHIS
jgi:pseudouridine kinase